MNRRPASRLAALLALGLAIVAPAGLVGAQSPPPVQGLIAYTVVGDPEMQVMVVSAADGAPTELWSGPFVQGLAWSPVDPVLATYVLGMDDSGPALGAHLIGMDGSDRAVDGDEPAASIWLGSELLIIQPTPTGSDLRLVDATGRTVQDLTEPVARVAGPIRTHPDGAHLAVTWEPVDSGDLGSLSIYDAPDWTRRDLPIPATRTSWSPDGTTLAAVAGPTVFLIDGTTGAARTAATSSTSDVELVDVRWSGDGTRLILTTQAATADGPDFSLRSVSAAADALDVAVAGGEAIELAAGVGDTIHVAPGPADAPLAWWSYGTAVLDWETAGTFRNGVIARDGLSVEEFVDITGPASLMAWDPTGTRLAISDAYGLSILDVATRSVTPLVAEPERGILEAAWRDPTD